MNRKAEREDTTKSAYKIANVLDVLLEDSYWICRAMPTVIMLSDQCPIGESHPLAVFCHIWQEDLRSSHKSWRLGLCGYNTHILQFSHIILLLWQVIEVVVDKGIWEFSWEFGNMRNSAYVCTQPSARQIGITAGFRLFFAHTAIQSLRRALTAQISLMLNG